MKAAEIMKVPLLPAMMVFVVMAMTWHVTSSACSPGGPHIVFITVADLGWRDVSWNSDDMATPNLAKLRSQGVQMSDNYVQATPTETRAALLTGKYPYTIGIHGNPYDDHHRWTNFSLPIGLTILPQYIKDVCGYNTHLIGSWMMGFCAWELTPTYRGFDSFYGPYEGNLDPFTHTSEYGGYDFRDNEDVDFSANGSYTTDLYTARAVQIIHKHHEDGDSRPLFLLLSYDGPHLPLQVPETYVNARCQAIGDEERRKRCGMMVAIDQGVGRVFDALQEAGYDDNLMLVFTSENGAPPRGGGSNWPLRGKKSSMYEGGVRVPAFIWSRTYLDKLQRFKGLVHTTDWLPSLMQAAGLNLVDLWAAVPMNSMHGRSKWGYGNETGLKYVDTVASGPQGRTSIEIAVNREADYGAIRKGKWKLVKDGSGICSGWYNPPEGVDNQGLLPRVPCAEYELFNLGDDPNETRSIVYTFPQTYIGTRQEQKKFFNLMRNLRTRMEEAPPSLIVRNFTESLPENHGGVWSPGWC